MKTKDSVKQMARLSGLLYLLIAVCGGFAFFGGYKNLYIPNSSSETTAAILNNLAVFKLGMIGDSLSVIIEVVLTVLLYKLLKPVNKTITLMATYARISMTVLMAANLLNKLIVMYLLSGTETLNGFNQEQLQALMMVFMHAYGTLSSIWAIFFGLHLVLVGHLLYQSTYFPKVLGVLFAIGGICYWIDTFGRFVLPQFSSAYDIIILFSVPAELSFAFYLLIKGLKKAAWDKVVNLG